MNDNINRNDNDELGAGGSRSADRGPGSVPGPTRREALKVALGAAAFAALPVTPADAERAMRHVEAALYQQRQGAPYRPKYFQPDEWRQVNIVVDLIIPKDDKSGSATDAGVPQYMDFFCTEYASSYAWMRDALRWFDGFSYSSFGKSFLKVTDAERRQLFDQVAWPAKAKPDLREGVNYFNRLRDFTASGFFSSQMGVKDLGYIGNVAMPAWNGCPPAALKHLGVG